MASRRWAVVPALLLVAGCGSPAATRAALRTARADLGRLGVEQLGRPLGSGTYGSAGLSGSRPTAFVAVQADDPADALTALGDRVSRAGFTPLARCRPPEPCTWERRADGRLRTATAVVLPAGRPWGERSTAHGTVAAGTSVLQVAVVVGG